MKSKKNSSSKQKSPSAKPKSHKIMTAKSKEHSKPAVVADASEEVSKYQHPGESYPDTQMVNPSLRMQRRR